jgi:hypothetical protein
MWTAQQVTYERPPEGLARGRYPAPAWVILVLAAVVVLASIAFLIARARAPKPPVEVFQLPGEAPKPPSSGGAAGASPASDA